MAAFADTANRVENGDHAVADGCPAQWETLLETSPDLAVYLYETPAPDFEADVKGYLAVQHAQAIVDAFTAHIGALRGVMSVAVPGQSAEF